jgi:hypothetical protein
MATGEQWTRFTKLRAQNGWQLALLKVPSAATHLQRHNAAVVLVRERDFVEGSA